MIAFTVTFNYMYIVSSRYICEGTVGTVPDSPPCDFEITLLIFSTWGFSVFFCLRLTMAHNAHLFHATTEAHYYFASRN